MGRFLLCLLVPEVFVIVFKDGFTKEGGIESLELFLVMEN